MTTKDALRSVFFAYRDGPAPPLFFTPNTPEALTTLFVECDKTKTLAEQAAKLDDFEKETGLRLAVLTLPYDMRPKSFRAAGIRRNELFIPHRPVSMIGFLSIAPTDLETWTAIQTLLSAFFNPWESVPAPFGRWFTPCVAACDTDSGKYFVNTTLRTAPVSYDAADVLACLEAYVDVPGRILTFTIPAQV